MTQLYPAWGLLLLSLHWLAILGQAGTHSARCSISKLLLSHSGSQHLFSSHWIMVPASLSGAGVYPLRTDMRDLLASGYASGQSCWPPHQTPEQAPGLACPRGCHSLACEWRRSSFTQNTRRPAIQASRVLWCTTADDASLKLPRLHPCASAVLPGVHAVAQHRHVVLRIQQMHVPLPSLVLDNAPTCSAQGPSRRHGGKPSHERLS